MVLNVRLYKHFQTSSKTYAKYTLIKYTAILYQSKPKELRTVVDKLPSKITKISPTHGWYTQFVTYRTFSTKMSCIVSSIQLK